MPPREFQLKDQLRTRLQVAAGEANVAKATTENTAAATGQCLCGAVQFEIGIPARWAWHDHSGATRRAHGAAYATYVGSWRSRFRVTKGQAKIARFEDKATRTTRGFCSRCGTPILYERAHSPQMVNIPRALFNSRTGREPRYHIAIAELQDWTYLGEPLVPLKGYPGVVWERPAKKKRPQVIRGQRTGYPAPDDHDE